MRRKSNKKLNIINVCDKICELEGYLDYLKELLNKPFSNKDEVSLRIKKASAELRRYKKLVMEVPDA